MDKKNTKWCVYFTLTWQTPSTDYIIVESSRSSFVLTKCWMFHSASTELHLADSNPWHHPDKIPKINPKSWCPLYCTSGWFFCVGIPNNSILVHSYFGKLLVCRFLCGVLPWICEQRYFMQSSICYCKSPERSVWGMVHISRCFLWTANVWVAFIGRSTSNHLYTSNPISFISLCVC